MKPQDGGPSTLLKVSLIIECIVQLLISYSCGTIPYIAEILNYSTTRELSELTRFCDIFCPTLETSGIWHLVEAEAELYHTVQCSTKGTVQRRRLPCGLRKYRCAVGQYLGQFVAVQPS